MPRPKRQNSRRRIGSIWILASIGLATRAALAENLPPLQADPALLEAGVVAAKPTAVSSKNILAPAVAKKPEAPKALVRSNLATAAVPLDGATYIVADRVTGINEVELVAEGNADLRKQGKRLTADKLTFWETDAEVEAVGNVRLTQEQDLIEGPYLRLKTEQETGYFDQPSYRLKRKSKQPKVPELFDQVVYPGEQSLIPSPELGRYASGSGKATRLDFEGEDKYRLTDATYSTCEAPTGTQPDWYARASSFELNYVDEEGVGRNSSVYFQNVPILYSPWLSFSLNGKRRSGLLAPSFGSSTLGGLQYAQPYYWNIAPNRDATIKPNIMSKRGLLLAGEFRYLEPLYSGTVSAQYLPNDKITGTSRDAFSLIHAHNFGGGFNGSLNLNAVSDYRFFGDLGNSIGAVAQTNLLRQGVLSYGSTWWSASLMAQAYQTLQDPLVDPQKLNEPYRRLPQLTLAANRSDLPLGAVLDFKSEYVQFRHPTKPEASRLSLYPQISLPLVTAATYITPKLGVHASHYDLNQTTVGVPDKISRTVPIFSVESGITFERTTDWFGKNFTQTLEPKLHYLYAPARDQANIPVFDSGLADFNFATIFADNRYGGGDRIGDANQLTAMAASRLLDPDTGAEIVRGAIGQRTYFSDQFVGLPGEILRSDRKTDVLGALSGRIAPNTFADFGIQYSPRFSRTERLTLSARYQPDIGHLLNASYRFNRDQLGQIDLSTQWPLWGRWNVVGRVNYSTKDHHIIENIAGLEYDAGCWAMRGAIQQFATIGQTFNQSLMFQLELKGLSTLGIGSSLTSLLKRNIPGYGIIDPSATSNSFTTE